MKKTIEIANLENKTRYWLVRADGGKYYDQFKYKRFISVQHNKVTIESLETSAVLLTKEKSIEHYKNKISNVYSEDELSKHQITFIAKKLYNFIEEMSIGDYVIIPSHKSNYFLIGEITSEVFEVTETDESSSKYNYPITTDLKRRKINWINEVPRTKINSKFLYSTLTMHQSIIEVTKYSKYINGLISPLYIKDGKLNLRLSVNTKESINSETWRALYSLIEEVRDKENSEEIIATINVESPGEINLQSVVQFLAEHYNSGLLTLAILFGEVDISGMKFKGVFPWLSQRKSAKLQLRKEEIEVNELEKDAELKDLKRKIDIEKATQQLNAIRNLDITIDTPKVFYENEYQTQMDFVDSRDEG